MNAPSRLQCNDEHGKQHQELAGCPVDKWRGHCVDLLWEKIGGPLALPGIARPEAGCLRN